MIDVLYVHAKSEEILAPIRYLQYFAYAVFYDFENRILWNIKNKDCCHGTFLVYYILYGRIVYICERKDWTVDEMVYHSEIEISMKETLWRSVYKETSRANIYMNASMWS